VASGTFAPVSGFTVAKVPTAAQVNAAVADGADYIDCQQDQTAGPDFGSFGGDVPETAAAIIGYGVLDKGNIANLPTAFDNPACPGATRNLQTDLTNALTWMLGQQDTTDPVEGGSVGGSWTFESVYYTYSTGLALTALGLNNDVPALASEINGAIALGRAFLFTPGEFENEPPPGETGGAATCTTTPNDYVSSSGTQDTSYYCGGWNYEPEYLWGSPRSDESNTGYALTGLHLTGGLTPDEAALNLGWQTNDQADTTTNSFWAGSHDDGGGSYQPAIVTDTGDDFSSNANDSGSLLFGFADDNAPISSPQVDAAIQFDTDALDTYEKQANTDSGGPGYETGAHVMVFHDAATEDGSCAPGATGCDWGDGSGEGGFHYSLFTIAKGLGSYLPANLSDGSNWYAKIADLLVSQQDTTSVCIPAQDTPCNFGSWPPDLRDDFSTIFATGLSIVALGLVATPPPPLKKVTSVAASPVCTDVALGWTNPTTPNYGGVFIQRSTTGFPATPADGTRVANVPAPRTTFTDKNLVPGTKYYYALFAHDTTGQAVAGGADIAVTPTCTAPPALRNLTAIGATALCSEVLLAWTNPTTKNYGGAYIQRSRSGFPANSAEGTRVAAVGASRTGFTDEHLVPGKKYYYALFAHDTTGLAIAKGADVVATPTCRAPQSLKNLTAIVATAECTAVVLTWTSPTTTHYGGTYIQRSTSGFPATSAGGTRVADVGASRTTFTDRGLVPDTKYYFTLFAHDTTGLAVAKGAEIVATPTCTIEYRLEGGDGGVFDFHASFYGSVPDRQIKLYDFVGMASALHGYWLVTRTGSVFNFGSARSLGSLSDRGVDVDDIMGIAASGTAGGYWLVSSTGTVYPFGDARHLGSLTSRGVHVHDVVAIASPGPGGYWLVTSTGQVFGFGNALPHGSCEQKISGCSSLKVPIVAVASPDPGGYWLVDRDGGVFAFGDATFHGSCAEAQSGCFGETDVVGIAAPDAGGYWIVNAGGSVRAFGDARQYGGCPSAKSGCQKLNRPIVAISSGQAPQLGSATSASRGTQFTSPSRNTRWLAGPSL
jgi:hypothetical protein